MPGDLLAPGRLGREIDLAAQPVGGLEQDHLVAAQRRDPGRLHPADAAADHHDLAPRARPPRHDVRHGRLAPGGRVVDAERVLALVDPVDAVAHADAGPDAMLLAAL